MKCKTKSQSTKIFLGVTVDAVLQDKVKKLAKAQDRSVSCVVNSILGDAFGLRSGMMTQEASKLMRGSKAS